jgi:outer membrane protein assembly factor BamB
MKRRIAVTMTALGSLGGASVAADWPQWRGPNRDGTTVGVELPAKWPATLKQIWEKKIGAGVSSPVMAGGRIYVHSRQDEDEVVSCLDPADGRTVWSGRYPAPWQVKPGAGDDKGPHSTPTVAGSRLFTVGINGVLTCWDARNGDVKWRWSPPDEANGVIPMYGAALSPVVADGLVFAHGSGEQQTAIAAFDAATGTMQWAWHGAGPAYATPVLAELTGLRQLVILTENKLAGLSPADGTVLWTKPLRRRNSYENIITPVVYKDLVIYAETGYPEIIAVRIVRDGDAMKVEDVWTNRDHRLQECTPII